MYGGKDGPGNVLGKDTICKSQKTQERTRCIKTRRESRAIALRSCNHKMAVETIR
jgi:hypothetical protein